MVGRQTITTTGCFLIPTQSLDQDTASGEEEEERERARAVFSFPGTDGDADYRSL